MIDLHCHLLPGVDDGPDTLEEAVALCRIAAADGITLAVCTPHIHPGRWDNTREAIARACANLQGALDGEGIPLRLGYAAEVRLTDELMTQVAAGDIPFYGEVNGYRILLLEFPHNQIVPGSDKLVHWLLARRIRPLIAHPERNKEVMKDPARIASFVRAGCWLQLTGRSLLGGFGDRAREVALQLLEQDWVAVVASDGHNAGPRRPELQAAYEEVALRHGELRAQRLFASRGRVIAAAQFQRAAA